MSNWIFDGKLERCMVAIPNRVGLLMAATVVRARGRGGPMDAIVFNQTGLQNRGGVGDYFRQLADQLALAGYLVVRYDPTGTGDSEGLGLPDAPLDEYFCAVESGAHAEDAMDVNRWTRATFSPRRLFLWGQCDGALTAMFACEAQPADVSGLILLGLPVLHSSPLEEMRSFDAEMAWRGYLQRATSARSYLRRLRGESDYRFLAGAVKTRLRQLKRRLAARLKPTYKPDHARFNWNFWRAYRHMMELELPLLFLLCELDNETPDFNQEFRAKVLDNTPDSAARCSVVTLPRADHSLMTTDGRERALREMLGWLANR